LLERGEREERRKDWHKMWCRGKPGIQRRNGDARVETRKMESKHV